MAGHPQHNHVIVMAGLDPAISAAGMPVSSTGIPDYGCAQIERGKGRGVADAVEEALALIQFGDDGLVPAIAQQHDTGEVLMLAWMNREAVRVSLAEGRACYWSRSRNRLWRKGETSGQVQVLRELRVDCDSDALLLLVEQHGVACHTGRRSCFFRAWREGAWATIAAPQIDPDALYPKNPG